MPQYVRILWFLQLLIAVYLVMNGLGAAPAAVGPYAAAVTALLFTTAIGYVIALKVAFEQT